MGFDPSPLIEFLAEARKYQLKSELKANRKKNGEWMEVKNYPIPNQVVAVRDIAPRGYEEKWKNGMMVGLLNISLLKKVLK